MSKYSYSVLFTINPIIRCLLWLSLFQLSCLVACQNSSPRSAETEGDKLLAEVEEAKLYQSDIKEILLGLSSKDSAQIINQYIDAWVRKQVLFHKAKKEIPESINEDIAQKLAAYQQELVLHEYQEKYLADHLKKNIEAQELLTFFEANQSSFLLSPDIVKARLLAFPKSFEQINEINQLIQSDNIEDQKKLKEYCIKFANYYHLNDSTWVALQSLVKEAELNEFKDSKALGSNQFFKIRQGNDEYFIKILEFKPSGEPAPFPFVQDKIKEMMLNRRKIQLIKKLEVNTFEEASKKKTFKVYK